MQDGLRPVSRTPSLGVMMEPEVGHGARPTPPVLQQCKTVKEIVLALPADLTRDPLDCESSNSVFDTALLRDLVLAGVKLAV
jgi:hypothetical protein